MNALTYPSYTGNVTLRNQLRSHEKRETEARKWRKTHSGLVVLDGGEDARLVRGDGSVPRNHNAKDVGGRSAQALWDMKRRWKKVEEELELRLTTIVAVPSSDLGIT